MQNCRLSQVGLEPVSRPKIETSAVHSRRVSPTKQSPRGLAKLLLRTVIKETCFAGMPRMVGRWIKAMARGSDVGHETADRLVKAEDGSK